MIPPLAFIIIPFILISLLTGLFFRSVTKSITGPIGNDMKWSGERIARAIEGPIYTDEDDNSYSPALEAALAENKQENKATTTVKKKKKKAILKKNNLIDDINDFLKEERNKGESNDNGS